MNKRIVGVSLLVMLTVSLWADPSLWGAAAAKADASKNHLRAFENGLNRREN